jgi:hypothetical protein
VIALPSLSKPITHCCGLIREKYQYSSTHCTGCPCSGLPSHRGRLNLSHGRTSVGFPNCFKTTALTVSGTNAPYAFARRLSCQTHAAIATITAAHGTTTNAKMVILLLEGTKAHSHPTRIRTQDLREEGNEPCGPGIYSRPVSAMFHGATCGIRDNNHPKFPTNNSCRI